MSARELHRVVAQKNPDVTLTAVHQAIASLLERGVVEAKAIMSVKGAKNAFKAAAAIAARVKGDKSRRTGYTARFRLARKGRGSEATPMASRSIETIDEALKDCASAEDLGNALSVGALTIRRWKRENRILWVEVPSGRLRYPLWQAHCGLLLPHLGQIIAFLIEAGGNERDRLHWFLTQNYELAGQSPLEVLRSSNSERALRAAEARADIGR